MPSITKGRYLSLDKAVGKFKSIEGHTLHCAIEDILDEQLQTLKEMDVIIAHGGLGYMDDQDLKEFLISLKYHMGDWNGDLFFIEAIHDRKDEEDGLKKEDGDW